MVQAVLDEPMQVCQAKYWLLFLVLLPQHIPDEQTRYRGGDEHERPQDVSNDGRGQRKPRQPTVRVEQKDAFGDKLCHHQDA